MPTVDVHVVVEYFRENSGTVTLVTTNFANNSRGSYLGLYTIGCVPYCMWLNFEFESVGTLYTDIEITSPSSSTEVG